MEGRRLSYENHRKTMLLQERNIPLIEKLLLMVAEAKTEYNGEYPEREEISKVLREITCDEYIEKDALEDILSGEFYRKMLGENSSFLRKLSTFASLTTGTREWNNKIIPVGHNPFPLLKSASLLFMTVPPALGTLSLLIGQNYLDFFLNVLLYPSLMKLTQTFLKLTVYRRLGLNFYFRLPVRTAMNEQGYHTFQSAKLIKTTTPAVKLKEKLTKKLIKEESEKADFIVYAVVNLKDDDKKNVRVIPLKDCLPISYVAMLSNDVQEVWIEKIPIEKIKRALTGSYERYITEWCKDYKNLCKQPIISENHVYEHWKYPVGLAYKSIQRYDFWNKRKIFQELIAITLYYVLLQNMEYQDALKNYCRLMDAIYNFQKQIKKRDKNRDEKDKKDEKNRCESSEEYRIGMSILSKKNRKQLKLLLKNELGNEKIVKDLLNVMKAASSVSLIFCPLYIFRVGSSISRSFGSSSWMFSLNLLIITWFRYHL